MILFLACCALPLSLWLIRLQRSNKKLRDDMVLMEERHQREYAAFISKVNHQGPVPEGSTVLGLTRLVSLGLARILTLLADLRERKDWNTLSVTQEISDIRNQELKMLDNHFTKFLASIRKVLEDHNHKQEP